ncbi:hypothetical protein EV361DRAFT_956702 [Lentinula raphanica]|nr:hypothetical protein EV361DRAFT_956702 [Lentinula raphanica]
MIPPNQGNMNSITSTLGINRESTKIGKADASGRVTNVKGNRHKGYKIWAQALEGWRQNCSSYHDHPPEFVNGTPYSPITRPETPPPLTPPPSRQNIEYFNATATKPSTPSGPSLNTPQYPMRHTTTQSDVQYWAIRSHGFVGVVSSTAQAQVIADEAAARGDDISMRLPTQMPDNLPDAGDVHCAVAGKGESSLHRGFRCIANNGDDLLRTDAPPDAYISFRHNSLHRPKKLTVDDTIPRRLFAFLCLVQSVVLDAWKTYMREISTDVQ